MLWETTAAVLHQPWPLTSSLLVHWSLYEWRFPISWSPFFSSANRSMKFQLPFYLDHRQVEKKKRKRSKKKNPAFIHSSFHWRNLPQTLYLSLFHDESALCGFQPLPSTWQHLALLPVSHIAIIPFSTWVFFCFFFVSFSLPLVLSSPHLYLHDLRALPLSLILSLPAGVPVPCFLSFVFVLSLSHSLFPRCLFTSSIHPPASSLDHTTRGWPRGDDTVIPSW